MSSPMASESSNARTNSDKIERLRVFQSAHGLGRSPDVRTNILKSSDRVPSPLSRSRSWIASQSRNAGRNMPKSSDRVGDRSNLNSNM
ncbi:hypothetical protein V6N13_148110 [Hibiscus sabdariffa]